MRLKIPERFIRRCRSDGRGGATVGAQQIYIIPTRQGLGFALLLLLMWIGSINYANNLGFLLTFLLAGLGLVAMLHTWRNLLGLTLRPGHSAPVFKGQQACFEIQISNSRDIERPGVLLNFAAGDPVAGDLAPHSEQTFSLTTRAERRGRLPMPRCTLSTRYPLGLLYAWSYLELAGEVLVYPAPGPHIAITSQPSYQPSPHGDKGVGSDDFIGLRSYRPGDSPRQIDWKAQAREQGLHTKQFGGDRADLLWIDWDHYPGMETESRLSALCRAVLEATEQHQAFGLRLPNLELKPARGDAQRRAALAALALFGEQT
ncbi:DUF58 domain-containing protein [Sedimenticola selenatireducens]|uniref:DUF58 domain-containing protein n=1 Tax=Sedimenticola selenatireducens TaxID=191960 RepID=A0A2N6CU90_9GAMM|nr:DUF58 domain-containing protein [Sedimenticola selenatireducens]PLX60729.1 MAG: DUF58 domain-containing protein [Sedimenticola selenatireducens]